MIIIIMIIIIIIMIVWMFINLVFISSWIKFIFVIVLGFIEIYRFIKLILNILKKNMIIFYKVGNGLIKI